MDGQQVIAAIRSLRLSATEYVVVGGAAMSARGIRDTNDIDLVVSPELFEQLARSGWIPKLRPNGKPGLRQGCIEAVLDVNTETFQRSTPWLIEHSEIIHGIPFVDLDTLTSWKRTYGRDKDIRDLNMLEAFRTQGTGIASSPNQALQPTAARSDEELSNDFNTKTADMLAPASGG